MTDHGIEVLYTVLEVLIAVACCLGNLLVIWAVWTCGAMRRQPTFCFIASLAIADFLVGAVALPLAVLVDGRVRTSFYSCVALCSVVAILSLASVHSLLAIALDRFLRVFIPLSTELIYTFLEVMIAVTCCLGNLLVIWAEWTCGGMRWQPTFCFIVSLAVADFLLGAVATLLEVLIAVACCLGDLLVIWAVWTCGAMRRQPTFCFIASLAIADFLVGVVAVPLAVLVDGRVRTSFYGCLFVSCLVIVLTQASVHSLLAIAVDRLLRVFIQLRTAHANGVALSSFICLLPPLVLMMVLYLCIFTRIHKQLRGSGASGSGSHTYYQKERKLAQSLLLVLVLFAVCWLPLHFMNAISFYGATVPHQAFYVGILLSHANSALNPAVYAMKIRKIKSSFTVFLHWFGSFLETEMTFSK
ncbi:hypothetical protein ACEWY4_013326 [Coilia grayii]|uniref:G-protein coupled receptors family 1 profile domain-containing protein n=1 Tax=Coilia grayii TaxID=363190 RepID=A0ABD1JW14_9TELE